MTRTCEEYAGIVRQSAKWVFGNLLNHYMGNAAIILAGEGPDGGNIILSATRQWLEANHVTNMGVTVEEGPEVMEHSNSCQSACCVAARERLTTVLPYVRKGQLPGGDGLAVTTAFCGGITNIELKRGEGMDPAIDEFMRFAPWFAEREFDAVEPPRDPMRHGLEARGETMHLRAGSESSGDE